MGILVCRDRYGQRDLVGRIDFGSHGGATFIYDRGYVMCASARGELGISEQLPLDYAIYTAEDFSPFFRGLLPEGEVYGNLAEIYQVPRSDYLTLLGQMGCESVGALTFISEDVDPTEYEPRYEPVPPEVVADMASDPAL